MMQEEERTSAEIENAKALNAAVSDTLVQDQKLPLNNQLTRSSVITILICASLSMLFMRIGILSLFFLAPLGFAVIATGSIFYTFLAAAAVNAVFSLAAFSSAENTVSIWFYAIYVTTLFLAFTWLIGAKNLRTLYRLIIASIAGAAALLIEFFSRDSVFYKTFFDIINLFSESIVSSQGEGITAVNPIFQDMTDPQEMMNVIVRLMLRGGALSSVLFLLFINRHLSLLIMQFIKKQRVKKSIIDFFAPQNTIWIFSGSLITIMLTGALKIEILEILAWNIFIICIIIYLAQGSAVLTHFLERRGTGFKIGITVLIIVLLISPLMLSVFGALLILGILENWIPFRLKKKELI